LVILLLCADSARAQCRDYKDCYDKIKALESSFPIPTPSITIGMGSLNATSGDFTGRKSEVEERTEDFVAPRGGGQLPTTVQQQGDYEVVISRDWHRKKRTIRRTYNPFVDAVHLYLTFELTGATDGALYIRPGGAMDWQRTAITNGTVTINVRDAVSLDWRLEASGKQFSSYMKVRRPDIIGAGVFTIPILPVTFVYEPISDGARKNTATYANVSGVCTTTEFSTSVNQTTPSGGSTYDYRIAGNDEMKSVLSKSGTVMAASKVPAMVAVGTALQKVADLIQPALGTATFQIQNTTGDSTTSKAIACVDSQIVLDTGANDGGPGVGDVLHYWKNVRMIWVAHDGRVDLNVLGAEWATASAIDIRTHLDAHDDTWLATIGLTADTATRLLGADVFESHPTQALPSPRFELISTWTEACGGSDHHDGFQLQSRNARTTSRTKNEITVRTEDYRAGFLAFAGFGITSSSSITTTMFQSEVSESTSSQVATATVDLYCTAADTSPYTIETYFDYVYRTFAFRNGTSTGTPTVSGLVRHRGSKPSARERVIVRTNNATYETYTDQNGRFAIHSPIAPGRISIETGNTKRILRASRADQLLGLSLVLDGR
jgi:hypothetical protein